MDLIGGLFYFYLFGSSLAKVYEKCELAEELQKLGFPQNRLGDWVCLIQGESSFDTSALSPFDPDGSRDYGLFQINSKYWCGSSGHNICKMDCEQFLDEDLSDDVKCVETIFNTQGFGAWTAWKQHCSDQQPHLFIEGCNNIKWTSISTLVNSLLGETEKLLLQVNETPDALGERTFVEFALEGVKDYLFKIIEMLDKHEIEKPLKLRSIQLNPPLF